MSKESSSSGIPPLLVGVIAGILLGVGFGWALPHYLRTHDSRFVRVFGDALGGLALPVLGVITGLMCVAIGWQFQRARAHRAELLARTTQLEHLEAMPWRDFERLVGEAFRAKGARVTETARGADGGVDLRVTERDGALNLVQCKQWRTRNVGVNVAREMMGLLAHHGAQRVTIVTLGGFTNQAKQFADGKPLTLVDGGDLLAMLPNAVQPQPSAEPPPVPAQAASVPRPVSPPPSDDAPSASAAAACPRCGAGQQVVRTARKTGRQFWGCSTFPDCRWTAPAG